MIEIANKPLSRKFGFFGTIRYWAHYDGGALEMFEHPEDLREHAISDEEIGELKSRRSDMLLMITTEYNDVVYMEGQSVPYSDDL